MAIKDLYTPEQIAKALRDLEKKICCQLAQNALSPFTFEGDLYVQDTLSNVRLQVDTTNENYAIGDISAHGININGSLDTISYVAIHHIFTGVSEHADNAAAILAGLVVGTVYRTGDLMKIVH